MMTYLRTFYLLLFTAVAASAINLPVKYDSATNTTAEPAALTLGGITMNLGSNTLISTSLQLKNSITDETGSGALVFGTSPTLVTPVLGVASATSINGLTITSSTGTITLTNGKTFSVSNSLTLAGTDSSTLNIGTGGTLGAAAYKAFAAAGGVQEYYTLSRICFVETTGNDGTGAIGMSPKPFLTVGAAYTAAKAASPTSSSPIVIQVGVGTFAESAIAMDTDYISIKGQGIRSTAVTFSSGGFTSTAGNWTIAKLSIVATGSNTGPLLSSCTRVSGVNAGSQYKAGTILDAVEIRNEVASGTALGGFFGEAFNCYFTSASTGIAVDLLWGGRLEECITTGGTWGVKDMIAYWPGADPFGANTNGGAGSTDSPNNRIGQINGGSVQAIGANGIAIHGLVETGQNWTATVVGENITNSPPTSANPCVVHGVRVYGPQVAATTGAAISGTLTVNGGSLWGTTCVRDMHDCYITGVYMNQFPNAGYVVQRIYNVLFVGCSIVSDGSVQTYRWLGGLSRFTTCYFEGNSTLQFTSTWLPYVEATCTDSSNGRILPTAGTAALPTFSTRGLPTHGFYEGGLGFNAWSVAGAYAGGFRTYGLSIGGTTGTPNLALNYSSGGAASGYYCLQFNGANPFTIGPFATGARFFSLSTTGVATVEAGDLVLATAGKTLKIKEGSNAAMGVSTLSAGTVTVSTTAIATGDRVQLTREALGSSTALGEITLGTITNSTSFVINSHKADLSGLETNDLSQVHWVIIKPSP